MVQVRVAGIALDQSGQHVILLQPIDAPPGASRLLPIWIGPMEATSIMVAIEGSETPRPLAHDLMVAMLESLGASVDRVDVTRIDDGTFYAEITLAAGGGIHRVDSRPSDAVALASRTGAPLFVADEVLAEAGVDDVLPDPDDAVPDASADPSPVTEAEAEADVAEFSRFLDHVDPDDFRE